ncbi:MAG: Hsp20/alpha crystallin family protein [Balneolaceae bacterium]|nr:MAG: Hsp20/alpha crystallin family protein [Balneolaceae bacterium]
MTITRYNPIRTPDYPAMPRSFTSLLDDFFNDVVTSDSGRLYVPSLDVSETDTHYHIQLALPGLKKDDINIDLQDRRLTITGERKEEADDKNTKYHVRETRYGSFERSIMLPNNIDQDKIDARFEDGILNLDVEKKEKQVNKQIKVK